MFHRFLLSLFVALTLIAVGCGEEEKKSGSTDTGTSSGSDTSGSTSGTEDGTSSGTDDTSGSTSGTEDGTTSGTEDGTTSGTEDSTSGGDVNLCQNQPDLDYLAATLTAGQYAGETGRDAASSAASACGLASISAEDPKAAVIACMQNDPHNIALTDGCTGCYGGIVLCTIEECINRCICLQTCGSDCTACNEACDACQVEKGCRAAFDECTGPLPE